METRPPNAEALKQIASRLREALSPEAIYLFGSAARCESTPDSDLDFLVVVKASDKPRHQRAQEARGIVGMPEVAKDIVVLTKPEWDRGVGVTCPPDRRRTAALPARSCRAVRA